MAYSKKPFKKIDDMTLSRYLNEKNNTSARPMTLSGYMNEKKQKNNRSMTLSGYMRQKEEALSSQNQENGLQSQLEQLASEYQKIQKTQNNLASSDLGYFSKRGISDQLEKDTMSLDAKLNQLLPDYKAWPERQEETKEILQAEVEKQSNAPYAVKTLKKPAAPQLTPYEANHLSKEEADQLLQEKDQDYIAQYGHTSETLQRELERTNKALDQMNAELEALQEQHNLNKQQRSMDTMLTDEERIQEEDEKKQLETLQNNIKNLNNQKRALDYEYTTLSAISANDFDQWYEKGKQYHVAKQLTNDPDKVSSEYENVDSLNTVEYGARIGTQQTYVITNPVRFVEENSKEDFEDLDIYGNDFKKYFYLKDEEKKTYYYLLGKNGEESANAYIDLITNSLNERMGKLLAEQTKGFLSTAGLAISSGLDQSISGLKNAANMLFGNDDLEISPTEYAAMYKREQLGSLSGFGFDLTQNVSNMALGITASALTGNPIVGTSIIGTSAAGNAYERAINEGYSTKQAQSFGILSGASEGLMQYFLGGISSLAGSSNVVGKAISQLDKLKNFDKIAKVLDKVALNPKVVRVLDSVKIAGTSMVEEGVEEYLQSIVETVFENMTLNANKDINFLDEEAWYSALLGAITGGLFSTVEISSKLKGNTNPFTIEDIESQRPKTQYFNGIDNLDDLNQKYTELMEEHQPELYEAEGNEAVSKRKKIYDQINEEYGELISFFVGKDLVRKLQNGTAQDIENFFQEISNKENTEISQDINYELSTKNVNIESPNAYIENISRELDFSNSFKEAMLKNYVDTIQNKSISVDDFVKSAIIYRAAGINGLPIQSINNDLADQSLTSDSKLRFYQLGVHESEPVKAYASQYPSKVSKIFIDGFDGITNLAEYKTAFDVVYNAGKNRIPKEEVRQYPEKRKMSVSTLNAAYEAGAMIAEKNTFTNSNNAVTMKEKGGSEDGRREEVGGHDAQGADRNLLRETQESQTAASKGSEGTGAQTARRGNGTKTKSRTVKTKTGREITYRYQETALAQRSPNAEKISQYLSEYGIENTITDGPPESRIDGVVHQSEGEASTLVDGSVLIRNDTTLNSENIAAHEMVHASKRLGLTEYIRYIDSIADNINIKSEAYQDAYDTIVDSYYGEQFDITEDYDMLYEELGAFISGDLRENNGTFSKLFEGIFFHPEEVISAWTDLHNAMLQRGKQNSNIDVKEDKSKNRLENWKSRSRTETNKSEIKPISEIILYARKKLNIPISYGRISQKNTLGIFKVKQVAIRTKTANDLTTISHEVGHFMDKKYNIRHFSSIGNAIMALDPEFASLYRPDQWPGEAVAEFMREYLSDRASTQAIYGEFFNEFENTLSINDLEIIHAIADDVNAYLSSTALERARASIVSRTDKEHRDMGEWVTDTIHSIVQNFQNVAEPLKRIFGERVFELYSRSLKANVVTERNVTGYLSDMSGNKVYDSLKDILSLVGKDRKNDFNLFLKLEHGLEYNKFGMRVFADESLDTKEAMEKMRDTLLQENPDFEELAGKIYEFEKHLIIEWQVKPGLITMEQAEEWFKKFPKYVPFFRKTEQIRGSGAKNSLANQKSPVKRARGSGADTYSPIENIMINIDQFVKSTLRNEVMKEIVKLINTKDGLGRYLEKVPPGIVPKTVSADPVLKFFNQMFDNNPDISQKMKEAFLQFNGSNEITDFVVGSYQGRDIVVYRNKGKTEYYQVHDTELLSALVSMGPQSVSPVSKMISAYSRVWKSMVTSLNLPWAVLSNLPRDIVTAHHSSIENNPIKFGADYVKAYYEILKNSDDYKKYKALGGGYSSSISNAKTMVELTKEVYKTNPNSARQAIMEIVQHPLRTIESISDFIEQGNRFAEFKRVLEQTGDEVKALYAGENLTVNFNLHGKFSKELAAIPFLNANIQGFAHFAYTLKNNPKQFFAKSAIGGIALVAIQQIFMALNGQEEEYEKLSNYQKNNFFCFAIGDGKFIKIPKAREYSIIENSIERGFEALRGQMDSDDWMAFLGYTAGNLFPNFSPTDISILGTYIELTSNKDFRGNPIVPAYMEDLVPKLQYDENTTYLARYIGNIFNLSPKQIDHIISSQTGILGQILSSIAVENKDYSMGFGNKVMTDSVYSTDIINQLYDKAENLNRQHNSYPSNGVYALDYARYYTMECVIRYMNKFAYAEGVTTEQKREIRRYARDMADSFMNESPKSYDSDFVSLYERIADEDTRNAIRPYKDLNPSFRDNKKSYALDFDTYMAYVDDYIKAIDAKYEEIFSVDRDDKTTIKLLKEAKKSITEQLKSKYIKKASITAE